MLSVSEYVTANVTAKPVSQRFCTKQITAVLWFLTCAVVKLHCFKTVTDFTTAQLAATNVKTHNTTITDTAATLAIPPLKNMQEPQAL